MKTRLLLCVLGVACLFSSAKSACNLTIIDVRYKTINFPDISKYTAESYVMEVEYTIPKEKQTDFYTEYYETIFKRGRVDSHINGESRQYSYRSETWEAWDIQSQKCQLLNITNIPDFMKDAQTDWLHYTGSEKPTTVGPSAMLKNAYDVWMKPENERNMAYMGPLHDQIRGEDAIFWRRCMKDDTFVDYFFADPKVENPDDTDDFKFTPLRVAFYGGESDLAEQYYDIINFKHFIPKSVEPFQLPKGRNCKRSPLADGPKMPDFSSYSRDFSAEVIYQKLKDGDVAASYYSTLKFALDVDTNHLAYYYSSWNSSKPGKNAFINSPHYIIFDMSHAYEYKVKYETGKCEVTRTKDFVPQYILPENGGSLSLTDSYVFFPNNELQFLTELSSRGMRVNVYEAEIQNYKLGDVTVPRVLVSHSYLKFNVELENSVAVRYAPAQIEMRFFKENDVEEILTFNVFDFSVRIKDKRKMFDVTRCFKNDDDSLYLTIGFEIEPSDVEQVEKNLPEIERNVLTQVQLKSELNSVRIPDVMTMMKDNYVYVMMTVLGKPPLILDFPDQEADKSIKVSNTEDTQGVSNFETCANNCLETRNDCWGFSLCGATCYYGTDKNKEVETKKDCTLYRKIKEPVIMSSKEQQVDDIVKQVEAGEFLILVDINKQLTLTATLAQITDPAEDDSLFQKMGNLVDPRMRVFKAGFKLKKGTTVKSLGNLRYDECQSLCLDFRDCETVSFCLINSECRISTTYGSDLTADDTESDSFCNLLTKQYTDHFTRTPGVFLTVKGGVKKDASNVEDCAKACLKETEFKCLSFDHCAVDTKGCTLYTVHYVNPKDRVQVQDKNPRCGHYARKFSTEYKRKDETRVKGSTITPIFNVTLEDCAKSCKEYGNGTCYSYNFCQGQTLYATSCTLIDADPSKLETTYNAFCTNFVGMIPFSNSTDEPVPCKKDTCKLVELNKTEIEYQSQPYSSGYAGGIGFLCVVIGVIFGAGLVFVIAYLRVNKR